MAILLFSQIVNASVVAFDPQVDQLRFDVPGLSAASVRLSFDADLRHIGVSAGGIHFQLSAASSLGSFTRFSTLFDDGSLLIVGDDAAAAGDAGANALQGAAGADQLLGLDGNDTLDGGAGGDRMVGGNGADVYRVDHTGDRVVESVLDAGVDTVYSTLVNYTLPANVENGRIATVAAANLTGNAFDNLLFAGAGANRLDGGAGRDTVSYAFAAAGVTVNLADTGAQATGGSGSDTLVSIENLVGSAHDDRLTGNTLSNRLDGGAGADTMSGGRGSDSYVVDATGDQVIETESGVTGGTDVVSSRLASYTLGDNVEQGRILSRGTADLSGNALSNLLYAGAGDNRLDGGVGNDTVSYVDAGAGVSVNLVSTLAQATGGSGSDRLLNVENLVGSAHDDRLTGNAAANRLQGGVGNDTLEGGAGADTLDGGAGRDLYRVDNLGDLVIEADDAGGGIDLVASTLAAYTLGAGVEEGRIVSSGAANLTGNFAANLLYAGAGNNVIDGGGDGRDTVSYAFASAAVRVSLSTVAAQATGGSGSDTLLRIANLVGSAHADGLTGNALANQLDGGSGADTLTGGAGDDVYRVDSALDLIVEAAGGGVDRVDSSAASFTLGAQVEQGRIVAAGSADLTGNALDNLLVAGAGNNLIDGGSGRDTVSYAAAAAAVTVSLAAAGVQDTGGSGLDRLLAVEDLIGSAHDDLLSGNAAANRLDGGAGADTLRGGAGDDTYLIDEAGDQAIEADASPLVGGVDTVLVSATLGSYTMGIGIDVVATAAASPLGVWPAQLLFGNALDNRFIIHVAGGDSSLDGSAGSDTLVLDSSLPDRPGVSESLFIDGLAISLPAGSVTIDWTYTRVAGDNDDYIPGSTRLSITSIENLAVSGSNVDLLGDAQANRFELLDGNGTLDGGGGADTLNGAASYDMLIGGAGSDVFVFEPADEEMADQIVGFVSGVDRIAIVGAFGNGNTTIDGAVTRSAPGGFAASAELVVFSADITSPSLDAAAAAATIGSASSAYATGATRLFVVDSGSSSALFLFTSSAADATVSASELVQLALLSGTSQTVVGDYQFGA